MIFASLKKWQEKPKQLSATVWVGSLYFIEGLPYTLVNSVSVALFKTMSVSNSQIGLFTSLLYLPWTIKFLWAPIVNCTGKLRTWVITLQIILASLALALSLGVLVAPSFNVLWLIFAMIAVASATYDIACDGYYLEILNKKVQALYVGWRNTAYKLAWLFGSGTLLYIAGQVAAQNPELNSIRFIIGHTVHTCSSINIGWCTAFLLAASIFLALGIFHYGQLPDSSTKIKSLQDQQLATTYKEAFTSFFKQSKIGLIILWVLIFRVGDAMLLKMAQPFFLDIKEKGGLGLTLPEVGLVYGTIGMICLLLGGLVGSWLVFKFGLKKCLLPTAVLQSLTLLLYWLLAIFKPGLANVALANAFEQFAYGLATTAYTSYLFTIVKEQFLTSHYAIATGLMAIGIMLPGAASGYLVDWLGYQKFFLISFFCSLPGILCTSKLPFARES